MKEKRCACCAQKTTEYICSECGWERDSCQEDNLFKSVEGPNCMSLHAYRGFYAKQYEKGFAPWSKYYRKWGQV